MAQIIPHTVVTQELVGAKSTYGIVLYDGSGNIISSFGGGTQYTDGDTDSSVTGTAAMGKDPSNNIYVIQLDASKNLKVAVSAALPAGTNLVGQVSASAETSSIYSGTTALTPKFATIAAASSGNNTLIAAVSSKRIRVLAAVFMGNGTVNVKFQDGAGGTDLTGLFYLIANTGACLPFNPAGWFQTSVNTLLNLNLSGAIAVGGCITYVEV